MLPEWDPPEQPTFSPEDMRRIIAAAEPPYDTVYWLVAQTGIRRGEACGLDVGHVDLTNRVIIVKRSRSGRHITDTKSRKPRIFSISPRLADRLSSFVTRRNPDEPLFLSAEGMRLHPENLVKRKLKPLLKQLGLQGGLHAFRHGNATAQDRLHTPMKVRRERLGHVSSRTTWATRTWSETTTAGWWSNSTTCFVLCRRAKQKGGSCRCEIRGWNSVSKL